LIPAIYLLTGIGVWIIGDGTGFHLGASGLIYGLVSFLFFSGVFRKDRRSLALSLLVTFVYGSMVWGVFPLYEGVSWESHLVGAIIGICIAWFYRNEGQEEEYFGEDENEEQPVVPSEPVMPSAGFSYSYFPETGKFEIAKTRIPDSKSLFKYTYIPSKKLSKPNAKV
jgi:hypothetical protein